MWLYVYLSSAKIAALTPCPSFLFSSPTESMAALEGPASLRWLLNPASKGGPSPRRSPFHAESPARPGIETHVEDDAPKRICSSDFSGPISASRQALRPRDDNSSFNATPGPPSSTGHIIYPQSVSQSNKRRLDDIDDDRDCRVRVSSGMASDQPKPKFYKNKTAMRVPRAAHKPKREQWHFISVSGTPLQPKESEDTYDSKEGFLQCPYTSCPRSFDIYTQYDEMKAHYAQHANREAELEIRSRHIGLENVNGSCFSFIPRKYTPVQSEGIPRSPPMKLRSPRHKPKPAAQPAHTKPRRPSSASQKPAKPSQRGVARTIYDVTHPSRAPPPPKVKTKSSLAPEAHKRGRTIYDVQHPTARRSERLARKKDGDVQCKSKVR
ncbi:hypothetical protein IW262DRAFT_506619 [Armillaria fumosa]|nr:hypothetical protein IW262DRAFT_506619 [Armillaria fumosa]